MFIALYFGAPVISGIVAQIEHGTLIHILNSVGGGLAALGIAIIMQVIGKKRLLPFLFYECCLCQIKNQYDHLCYFWRYFCDFIRDAQ